ncbi:ABC transporter ATP-binding protein [Sphingomonas arenae]|uniref:ABC transporter ATP-binding protein n=1 Tax=Sphingomonas arenae TaxID=2812555 RepID=UPI001967F40C|nr:ABC transporter ATP-binding protein [Sphingomonas arenae]
MDQGLRTLLQMLTPRQRRRILLLLALMLVGGVSELLTIGAVVPFLALLADADAVTRFPVLGETLSLLGATSRGDQLLALTLAFMAATLVAAALRILLAWGTQRFAMRFGHHLAAEIHRRTLLQPYSWHVRHRSSVTISTLDQVQQLLFTVILPLLQGLSATLIALFIVAALIAVDPLTAFSAAAGVGTLYFGISMLTRSRIRRAARIIGKAHVERVRLVQESLGGIRDIIIDGSQDRYHDAFRTVDLRLNKARARLSVIAQTPRFLIEAVGMIAIAGLALLLAGRAGGIAAALPVLGALALGAHRLLPLIQQIYQTYTNLSGNSQIVGQVAQQLALPLPPAQAEPAKRLPFHDRIEIRQVAYSYPTRPVQVLRGIDMTIPRGAKFALAGRTGSGKSTLADLVMGLIAPDEGSILVDGIPLTDRNVRAWQNNIAHVSQTIFLSDASIASNIALGRPDQLDTERVRAAAREAALDDFIQSLPEGYETQVGERGVQLSGGQRQRLGLARALYKQAPFLVLDEATSALDPETEAAILGALDGYVAKGGTLLLIAHRSSTLAACDLIVRLEAGRIVSVQSTGDPERRALP